MTAEEAKTQPKVPPQAKPAAEAKPAGDAPLTGKKALPTNCTQCNVRIRRKAMYYRNGKYFCGPNCAKLYREKQAGEKAKAESEAKAKEQPLPAGQAGAAVGEETPPKAA